MRSENCGLPNFKIFTFRLTFGKDCDQLPFNLEYKNRSIVSDSPHSLRMSYLGQLIHYTEVRGIWKQDSNKRKSHAKRFFSCEFVTS